MPLGIYAVFDLNLISSAQSSMVCAPLQKRTWKWRKKKRTRILVSKVEFDFRDSKRKTT